jgi:hypothetical protein
MTWYYNGEVYDPSEEELKDLAAFVYVITDRSTGKKYVGKKFFWSKKTMPPLKGKTRKRRKQVISDWKDYFGSSEHVKQLIEEYGKENFDREILHLCKTRGEAGYMEAKEQFDRNVLLSDEYMNGIIQCRVHRSHVKGLKNENT